jgi:hypothetical protein
MMAKDKKKKIEGNRDRESVTKLSLPRHKRITRVSRKTEKSRTVKEDRGLER